MTEANVRKICFDDNLAEPRATGVAVLHGGQEHVFTANNEVILAAGAIASPQLLQLSGIGASETLHQHSIATLIELPGVGENLQDHLQIRTIYSVDNTITLNQRARTPWGMALMGLEYFLRKTGPLTMPPSQLGAFAKSDPPSPLPTWNGMCSRCRWINLVRHCTSTTPSHHQYATYGLRRGTVALKSNKPDDAPAIAPNYLSTQADLDVAVAGLRFTRKIMAAPALAAFNPKELKPGPEVTAEEDLQRAAGDLAQRFFTRGHLQNGSGARYQCCGGRPVAGTWHQGFAGD